jgi:hypothetical protein
MCRIEVTGPCMLCNTPLATGCDVRIPGYGHILYQYRDSGKKWLIITGLYYVLIFNILWIRHNLHVLFQKTHWSGIFILLPSNYCKVISVFLTWDHIFLFLSTCGLQGYKLGQFIETLWQFIKNAAKYYKHRCCRTIVPCH